MSKLHICQEIGCVMTLWVLYKQSSKGSKKRVFGQDSLYVQNVLIRDVEYLYYLFDVIFIIVISISCCY